MGQVRLRSENLSWTYLQASLLTLKKNTFSGMVRMKALLEQAQKEEKERQRGREEEEVKRTSRNNLSFAVGGECRNGVVSGKGCSVKGGFWVLFRVLTSEEVCVQVGTL